MLLVEDIAVNQLLARTLLEADGHSVDVVSSGEDAIVAIQRESYDVVLMDVQMPGMGGVAATKAIRALPEVGGLPIIAMTANVLSDQVRGFRESGMDDHIGKPIDRADLRATIARWLDRRCASPAKTAHTGFDEGTFGAISGLLGPDKTIDVLRKFRFELETRFEAGLAAPERRDAFRRDAHVVTSVAGMIGFTALAQQCASIIMLTDDEVESFEERATAVLLAKREALATLTSLGALDIVRAA